jgi:hypothetical protein
MDEAQSQQFMKLVNKPLDVKGEIIDYAIPIQVWTDRSGVSSLRLPELLDSRNMKAIMFSALLTGRLYPQEISRVLIFFRG